MALGDLFTLDLSANLLGQTVHNIFRFASISGNPTALQLAQTFALNVVSSLASIASNDLTYTDIQVINEDTPSDFANYPISVPGGRGSNTINPFSAWGFTYVPNTPHSKAGGKRFAGVASSDVADGHPSALILAELSDVAVTLGSPIITVGGNFRPRILSERCVKDPVTHRCTSAPHLFYRVAVNNVVFDWQTSQNSRKFGSGI